jgi:hypothetical protein
MTEIVIVRPAELLSFGIVCIENPAHRQTSPIPSEPNRADNPRSLDQWAVMHYFQL